MALTRLNQFNTGTTLTESAIEGEFDNIYSNTLSMLSPLTGNLACGGYSLTGIGVLQRADGTAAAPSSTFTSDLDTGSYSGGANSLGISTGGVARIGVDTIGLGLISTATLAWNDGGSPFTTKDTILARDAAATLALKNGAAAQTLRVYGTTTGNKYLSLAHDGTDAQLGTSSGVLLLAGDNGPQGVMGAAATTNRSRLIGTVSRDVTAVGNVGTGEDNLMTYTLPANALDANGRSVRVFAWGTFAANANTKTIRAYFGATNILTPPTFSGAYNATGWWVDFRIVRTGAATQMSIAGWGESGSNPRFGLYETPAETLSGAVVIKLTGEATADNDIYQRGMIVEFLN